RRGRALGRAGLLALRPVRGAQAPLSRRVAGRLGLPVLLRPAVVVPLHDALRLVLLLLVHARAVLVAASLLIHATIPLVRVRRSVSAGACPPVRVRRPGRARRRSRRRPRPRRAPPRHRPPDAEARAAG